MKCTKRIASSLLASAALIKCTTIDDIGSKLDTLLEQNADCEQKRIKNAELEALERELEDCVDGNDDYEQALDALSQEASECENEQRENKEIIEEAIRALKGRDAEQVRREKEREKMEEIFELLDIIKGKKRECGGDEQNKANCEEKLDKAAREAMRELKHKVLDFDLPTLPGIEAGPAKPKK